MNIENEKQFVKEAQNFSRLLKPGTLILMSGTLGSGKTLWVRSVVEALGGKWVSSPSFAVIQHYQTKAGPVDHVDLYRLKNDQDIESTGFWDLFQNPAAIVFIEWAERIPSEHWPKTFKTAKIEIETVERHPDARVLRISAPK
jgi:tRNA threonylcarbamoyladenosine biosynthesis protein TsaE